MCNTYNQKKANSLSIEGESLENHQHRPETSQDWKLNNDLTLPHMIRMIRIFSRIFWQKQKKQERTASHVVVEFFVLSDLAGKCDKVRKVYFVTECDRYSHML